MSDLEDTQAGELPIVRTETAPALTQGDKIAQLMQIATEQGAGGVETLERLMDLQERFESRQALRAYMDAMSEFQAECPDIVKTRAVAQRSGALMYRYAALEDIVEATRDLRKRLGFTHRWTTVRGPESTEICCIVSHREGHSEKTCVAIPRTQGQNTNAAQNEAIGITYGQRYSFLGAFGIVVRGEDRDALDLSPPDKITESQVLDLEALIEEVGADRGRFLKWAGVDSLGDLPADRMQKAIALLEKRRRQ